MGEASLGCAERTLVAQFNPRPHGDEINTVNQQDLCPCAPYALPALEGDCFFLPLPLGKR